MNGSRKLRQISLIIPIILTSSCSYFSGRKTVASEEATTETSVPKAQYDELMNRYQKLLDDSKKGSAQVEPNPEASEMIDKLGQVTPTADAVETVNVFQNEPVASKPVIDAMVGPAEIQAQISQLRRGIELVEQNKFNQALMELKNLTTSPVDQIRVRAKYQIAEMMFKQNEFDLALQMFEELISTHAYSGVVLNAVGRIIVCTEKLQLKDKKQKYYSIMHDFFEAV